MDEKNFKELQEASTDLATVSARMSKEIDASGQYVLSLRVLNDLDQRAQLGTTSKVPRWVTAYKYESEQGLTKLLSIDVLVGKDGVLTPRANVEPLRLCGTTVSRASLHNAGQIEQKDIRVGDTVLLTKANEIIPYVIRSLPETRTGKEARAVVLGHIQRGGTPTAFDRWLATRFGLHAIDAVADRDFGTMVALRGTDIVRVPLSEGTAELKLVSPEEYAEAAVFFG